MAAAALDTEINNHNTGLTASGVSKCESTLTALTSCLLWTLPPYSTPKSTGSEWNSTHLHLGAVGPPWQPAIPAAEGRFHIFTLLPVTYTTTVTADACICGQNADAHPAIFRSDLGTGAEGYESYCTFFLPKKTKLFSRLNGEHFCILQFFAERHFIALSKNRLKNI
ncbi:hypothetical protein [Candidatus Halocynthiibacter alkanivorans]|uniref:hypothetical protein n=1 Tax=Candidatus Halocynthiibacter alkanivorans TaxID=2267619 RepID=UPI00109C072F|nr:hypothetical protein [Candidatus Halocynthiibacter alkanivorans]